MIDLSDFEANVHRAMPNALKMPLYGAKKQSYEIRKYTIEGVNLLCSSASLLKEYGDKEQMAILEETAKGFAVLDNQLAAYKAQLDKMDGVAESGVMV